MRGSLFKYIDERKDEQGQSLWWPGGQEGFPFRGEAPPPLRDQEYEDLKLFSDAYVRTFYMDCAEDVEEYRQIVDRVANGWFFVRDRDRRWDENRNCYVIFLEWIQVYSQTPQGVVPYPLMGNPDEQPRNISL